jgi:hypothetical protein
MTQLSQTLRMGTKIVFAMAVLALVQASAWAQSESPLTVTNGAARAHIMPTVARAAELTSPPLRTMAHSFIMVGQL